MRLDVHVGLEMRFVCVQCARDMVIKGQKDRNPEPVLECPACGFKVKVIQAPASPGIPGPGRRFPAVKPRRIP